VIICQKYSGGNFSSVHEIKSTQWGTGRAESKIPTSKNSSLEKNNENYGVIQLEKLNGLVNSQAGLYLKSGADQSL